MTKNIAFVTYAVQAGTRHQVHETVNRLWGQTPEAMTSDVTVTNAPPGKSAALRMQVHSCTVNQTDMSVATSHSRQQKEQHHQCVVSPCWYVLSVLHPQKPIECQEPQHRPLRASKKPSKQASKCKTGCLVSWRSAAQRLKSSRHYNQPYLLLKLFNVRHSLPPLHSVNGSKLFRLGSSTICHQPKP